MSLVKLRLSMLATLAVLIGISTLFFTIILSLLGILDIIPLLMLIIGFNILQWLIAPYMIEALYRAKEADERSYSRLYAMLRRISERSKMVMPKLMIADIPIPNAFAYGSPLSGRRVAVTRELLRVLDDEEVEAVLAHEVGHLKHRDVQLMMFASVLPAIFYYIGYSLMLSSMWNTRDRNAGGAVAVGIIALAIYWLLTLLVMGLSRLREYYADQHAVKTVDDGARKLAEGLAKITLYTGRYKIRKGNVGNVSAFKALFISDPDRADQDELLLFKGGFAKSDTQLVQEVLSRKITAADRLIELFSTHPNIVKRIRALVAA
ncbi:MAG: zinc metalloprotease HtpX [Nitrososphaerales archaeon]